MSKFGTPLIEIFGAPWNSCRRTPPLPRNWRDNYAIEATHKFAYLLCDNCIEIIYTTVQ